MDLSWKVPLEVTASEQPRTQGGQGAPAHWVHVVVCPLHLLLVAVLEPGKIFRHPAGEGVAVSGRKVWALPICTNISGGLPAANTCTMGVATPIMAHVCALWVHACTCGVVTWCLGGHPMV